MLPCLIFHLPIKTYILACIAYPLLDQRKVYLLGVNICHAKIVLKTNICTKKEFNLFQCTLYSVYVSLHSSTVPFYCLSYKYM